MSVCQVGNDREGKPQSEYQQLGLQAKDPLMLCRSDANMQYAIHNTQCGIRNTEYGIRNTLTNLLSVGRIPSPSSHLLLSNTRRALCGRETLTIVLIMPRQTRRTHTKSRGGCSECKRRKIKVGGTPPITYLLWSPC